LIATIKALSDLSKKLNQKSDRLNDTIESINQKLEDLNLGVETWLTGSPIDRSDPYYDYNKNASVPVRDETWLGYLRFPDASGWALAAKVVTLNERDRVILDGEPARPLLNMSRNIRVKAMKLIPELLDAIKDTAEELLQSIDGAEEAAKNL